MKAAKKQPEPFDPRESLLVEAPFIRRVLAGRGVQGHDLEDAVSTVFLAAIEGAPRYAPPADRSPHDAFHAWLYGISKNVAGRCKEVHWRAGVRLASLEVKAEGETPPTPEQLIEARERLAQVEAALAKLPEHVRTAYIAHDVDGDTIDVIGVALGTPASTVYKHIMRARKAVAAAARRTAAHDRRYAMSVRRTVRSAPPEAASTPADRLEAMRARLEGAASDLESAARSIRLVVDQLMADAA